MNMMYAANGKNVKRSKVTLHKKTMGCWLALEYCCWLVLEYSGSRFLLYISSRFLLYIKGSTYARTLLYGFLILIIRIHLHSHLHFQQIHPIHHSPHSPFHFHFFTFTFSLLANVTFDLLTFCSFESSPMLSPAVPSESQFQAMESPVPFLSRCPFPTSRRSNSCVPT